jgi:DNA excision repair protein ERCC-2
MKMIHTAFVPLRPYIQTIVQTPEMTETERDRFLERFSSENGETLVGFVVMGGIFGEGIDLAGERLSGAAVVGPGLPGICLERDLIRDYFDRHLQRGFEFAYLYPGIIRVLQAAGRVIRSENDRGVILLVGQRFGCVPYRDLLPGEWRPFRIAAEDQYARTLEAFW